jgi:3-dehydroquinate synthetase
MPTIEVGVNPAYSVYIEAGLLARAGGLIHDTYDVERRFYVVSVAPVRKGWGADFASSLAAGGLQCEFLEIKGGERNKKLATIEDLAGRMVRGSADRKSVLIAFGGGVVGDVTGFLASVFMRGIPYVQVPTTLLAQIDAAIGGKTGVNLAEGKNLVGTFYHPGLALIDPKVLSTLPEREYRSGLFEALALKYSVSWKRTMNRFCGATPSCWNG